MAGMHSDAPLSLLVPLSQLVIGGCVAAVLVVSMRRLLRRGPSRMARALVVTGGAALALVAVGMLLANR
jgi:hypothetical protein